MPCLMKELGFFDMGCSVAGDFVALYKYICP